MKIKITETQIAKLREDLVQQSKIHGYLDKGDHTAIVHHYMGADEKGKGDIINHIKGHAKGGEVAAQKIQLRARDASRRLEETNGVIDGISDANDTAIDKLVEVDNGMEPTDMSDGKPMPDFEAKPVNEFFNDLGDDNIYPKGTNVDPMGAFDEAKLDETTTSASSGQYSSKFFLGAKGKEKDHLQYPGGAVVKINPNTHDSGVNSFTTKGKLKENAISEALSKEAKNAISALKEEFTGFSGYPSSLEEDDIEEHYFKPLSGADNITSKRDSFAHYSPAKKTSDVSEDDMSIDSQEPNSDFTPEPQQQGADMPPQFTAYDLREIIYTLMDEKGEDHPIAQQLIELLNQSGAAQNPDAPVSPEVVNQFRDAIAAVDTEDGQEDGNINQTPANQQVQPTAEPVAETVNNVLRDSDFAQLWQTIDPSHIKYSQNGGIGTNLTYGNTPISIEFDRGGKTIKVGENTYAISDQTYAQTLYPVLAAIQGQDPKAMGTQRGSGEGHGSSASWWESKPQIGEFEDFEDHSYGLDDPDGDPGIPPSDAEIQDVKNNLGLTLKYGFEDPYMANETTGSAGGVGQFSAPLGEPQRQVFDEDRDADYYDYKYIDSHMGDFRDGQGLLAQAFGAQNVAPYEKSYQGHVIIVNDNGDKYEIGMLKDGRFFVKMDDVDYDKYNVFDSLQDIIEAIKSFQGAEDGGQEMNMQEEYNKPSTAMAFLKKVHNATAAITKDDMKKAGDVVKQGQKVSGVQFTGKVEDDVDQKPNFKQTEVQDQLDMIPDGMEDLKYANEPSDNFKKNFENGLNPVTKSADVEDQFGNKFKGEEHANVVDSDLGEKLIADVKKKQEAAKKQPEGANFIQRTQIVKEDENVKIDEAEALLISEDVARMQKLLGYTPKNYVSTKGNKIDNSLFKTKK